MSGSGWRTGTARLIMRVHRLPTRLGQLQASTACCGAAHGATTSTMSAPPSATGQLQNCAFALCTMLPYMAKKALIPRRMTFMVVKTGEPEPETTEGSEESQRDTGETLCSNDKQG